MNFGPGCHQAGWWNDWASSLRVWEEGCVNYRQYNVMCGKTPKGVSPDAGPWIQWTSSYDNSLSIDCGADTVLTGIKSENSNGDQDRIWACRCATVSVMAPRQFDFQVEYAE